MAQQPDRSAPKMQPSSPQQAPDPARSYGREKPEAEAGMGRLDNNEATPAPADPDSIEQPVKNKQSPRQINAHDVRNERAGRPLDVPQQPDHSMKDEEPLGADLAPTDIHNPRDQRHPRTEGKGGTP